jgi:hypothetical protein
MLPLSFHAKREDPITAYKTQQHNPRCKTIPYLINLQFSIKLRKSLEQGTEQINGTLNVMRTSRLSDGMHG